MTSKAQKRAAKMAARQAKKNVNKVENPVVENKVEEPVVEQPAAEETKVEQPTPTEQPKPEPAVEEIKEEKKEEKKDKKDKKDKKVPTFVPEEVDHKELRIQKPTSSSAVQRSSADAKSRIMTVIWEKYGKDADFAKQYPEAYTDMMRNLDVVTVLALADIQNELQERTANGELKLTVAADQIMPLQNIAGMLGIELCEVKALPGKGDDKQLKINFPEELKEKKEDTKPELDPSKISSEEELKKAIEFLLRETPNVAVNIASTIQWYHDYCIFKTDNADKKLEYDNRAISEWVNDIFSKVQPTAILRGLGRSLYLYTKESGSPITAHTVLHHHLSQLGYSEEAIADLVRALITEQFRYNLSTDPKANKDPKEDKAMMAIISNIGNDYIETLFKNFNTEITKDTTSEEQFQIKKAKEIIGRVRTNYLKDEAAEKKCTEDALRMAIGRIINLYRDPMNPLMEYEQSSVTSVKEGEYPPKKVTVNVNVSSKKK